MQPLRLIDTTLNRITMYKLVTWYLSGLLGLSIVLSFAGVLSLSGVGLLVSAAVIGTVCFVANQGLAKLYGVNQNFESGLITFLILTCILPPITTVERGAYTGLAALLAITSKYVIAWRYKHIFNPAAFGAAVVGLVGLLFATWWVGNPTLLPFTLVFGLLIARKIRRGSMVAAFAVAALAVSVLVAAVNGQQVFDVLKNVIESGPLIFLGTVMLTEPSTTPPRWFEQVAYGTIVGLIFGAGLHVAGVSITPQLALVLGNLYSFGIGFKRRAIMTLKETNRLTHDTMEFVFTPDKPFAFEAGQYLDWTLPGDFKDDARANRRTFSIASAPTEPEVRLGVKFYEPRSSFKHKLQALKPGERLPAGNLAGDFVLPTDSSQKMVWIAGGIGITPFRSMTKYLIDTNQQRDITLFYLVRSHQDIAYRELFKQAQAIGLKVFYVINDGKTQGIGELAGPFSIDMLKDQLQTLNGQAYYLSGPDGLVRAYKQTLRKNGIKRADIHTDYFAGY